MEEGLVGFGSFPANEQIAGTLILNLIPQMESLQGLRFQPTVEEIFDLLNKKRLRPHFSHRIIKDIDDICNFEPWELPAWEPITESQAYFFCELRHKYNKSNSVLINRTTNAGYWEGTGKPKPTNRLTVTKKIFTFYLHGPGSKKKMRKTDWVMHEFHVEDNPQYKKKFVLCRIGIGEKSLNKHGISTPDEGESSRQLGSPTHVLPSDQLLSNGNHIEEQTVTDPNRQLPYPSNLISHPQNHIQQTILTNQQLPPNNTCIPYSQYHIGSNTKTLTFPNLPNLISYPGEHIGQNMVTNQEPITPNHNMISFPWFHYQEHSFSNQQLPPNKTCIPYSDSHVVDSNTLTTPQLPNLISPPGNHIGQNMVTSQHPPPLNHDMISFPWNHIQDQTLSNQQLLPNQVLEKQLRQNKPLVINNVAEIPEEQLQHGENNGLNNSSFSAPEEISYSNYLINDSGFLNSQVDGEQVYDLINLRACQDENSPEGTGQTLTPDFNSLKSDGGNHAEDSSDTNAESFDAWLDELLIENIDEIAA